MRKPYTDARAPLWRNGIDLVDDDKVGLACKLVAVLLEFPREQMISEDGVGVCRTAIDQKQEDTTAFNVSQELVSESVPVACSFNQSWNVGKCDSPAIGREGDLPGAFQNLIP